MLCYNGKILNYSKKYNTCLLQRIKPQLEGCLQNEKKEIAIEINSEAKENLPEEKIKDLLKHDFEGCMELAAKNNLPDIVKLILEARPELNE